MGTKWTDQTPTPLRPRPGRPFYLYGADIYAEVRAALLERIK